MKERSSDDLSAGMKILKTAVVSDNM